MGKDQLEKKTRQIRVGVIKMLAQAESGHTAGPLGAADFWASLYLGNLIRYKASEPRWEERDRVVVSPGHYAPVIYATLAEAGFFPKTELATLRQFRSKLQGHPIRGLVPGIENCSGSLGQGLSLGVGMALAGKLQKKDWRVIVFLGDGEQDEGQTWEGYMAAAKFGLDNLVVFLDRNNIQIDGFGDQVMPIEPLDEKLRAFNWEVMKIDGNNLEQIANAFERAKNIKGKPVVVIMETVPGKGVSFMENDYVWHGKAPTKDEAEKAIEELMKRND